MPSRLFPVTARSSERLILAYFFYVNLIGPFFILNWWRGWLMVLGATQVVGSDSSLRTASAVLITIALMVYPVVLETLWRGRTIGKRALGFHNYDELEAYVKSIGRALP